MTIRIGPITLSAPVLLAPMSGITDLPFRRLAERFGAGLTVSEMVAGPEVLRRTIKTRRRMVRDNIIETARQGPRAVQLVGIDPPTMARAAKFCVDDGAELIDINFGCPTRKVTKKSSGSAIMRDENLATRIMEAVVASVDVPVTVKMRLGWDDADRNAPRLANIAQSVGVQMITVHARTRCQKFAGRADWRFLAEVKAAVDIPVVANGDIASGNDARRCLELSGCDAVMIGRASRGRPWLAGQIADFLIHGRQPRDPGPGDRLAIVQEHMRGLMDLYGTETGMRVARKHIAWYAQAAADDMGDDMRDDMRDDLEDDKGRADGSRRAALLAVAYRSLEPEEVGAALADFFSPQAGELAA